MLSLGMSENFLQLSAILDFASASFNTSLKKYCHALFLTCKGSTWAWSINLPIKGTNSCLLFLRAINSVTLLSQITKFSSFLMSLISSKHVEIACSTQAVVVFSGVRKTKTLDVSFRDYEN